MTGLRFLLEGGLFLDVQMSGSEARKLIKDWRERNPRLLEVTVYGDPDARPMGWAVKMDKVVGMHTFEVQTATTKFDGIDLTKPSSPFSTFVSGGRG